MDGPLGWLRLGGSLGLEIWLVWVGAWAGRRRSKQAPLHSIKLARHVAPPVPPQGVSGFLPKKDAAAAQRALAPGALVEVVVGAGGVRPGGGAGLGTATVTCAAEAVAGALAKEWEGLNIGGWRANSGWGRGAVEEAVWGVSLKVQGQGWAAW